MRGTLRHHGQAECPLHAEEVAALRHPDHRLSRPGRWAVVDSCKKRVCPGDRGAMQIPDAKARRVAGGASQGLASTEPAGDDQGAGSEPTGVGGADSGKRHSDDLAIARRRQAWANFWRAHWGSSAASGPRH